MLIRLLQFFNVLLLGISGGVAWMTHDPLALMLFVLSVVVGGLLWLLSA